MEVEAEAVSYARPAVVLGVICLLLILASVLLFVAVGFGSLPGKLRRTRTLHWMRMPG